jgi:hypothetical protein
MTTNPNLQTQTKIVPAGAQIPVDVTGSFVMSVESSGNLSIIIGTGRKSRFHEGDKYRLPEGFQFTQCFLVNDTGSSITAVIGVGDGDMETSGAVTISGSVVIDTGDTRAHGNDTVGTSAVELMAANSARRSWFVYNNGSVPIYVGSSSGVTTANGTPVPVGGGLGGDDAAAVFAISGSASQDVRHWEVS